MSNNNNFLGQIMQGGACNPDGSQMSHSSNPVRNFVQNVVLGRGAVNEKLRQYQYFPGEENAEMHQIPAHFENEFNLASQQMKNTHISGRDMHKMMNGAWNDEKLREEEARRMMEFEMRKAWEHGQQMEHRRQQDEMMMHKMMGGEWKNAELAHEAMGWQNDYLDEEYKNMEKEMQAAYADAEDIINRKEDEGKVVKEASNYMIDVMQSDPDPRFQNSKLLNFLKKLESGALEIKDNQLVQNPDAAANLENAWETANMEKAWQEEEHKVDFGGPLNEEAHTNKVFDDIWAKMQAGELNADEAELEAEYKKVLEKMEGINADNMDDVFADAWNVEQDVEEYHTSGDVPAAYNFDTENPYMNDPKAKETASNLLNSGKIKDAILALEAHLQQNPSDAASWRVLGKLHMDNDEDRPATRCLLNSVNLDPKNLDNLLALGVSCTNILDEVQAMNHLKHWMLNNPKYQNMPIDPNVIPDEDVGKSLTIEEIKNMNGNLRAQFEKARMANPTDPELATALAVLNFIARDYPAGINLFNEALKHDGNNYSLWNKLGATLAHLGRADESMDAYHRALEFKPNYVRAWVNLGIAHAYKGEFDEAARFYLSALSMNPQARHVWSYLQTTLLSLQRYDLLKLAANHDIEGFKNEFDIVVPEDLPAPEIEYKMQNEQFLVKQNSENWVNDFAK